MNKLLITLAAGLAFGGVAAATTGATPSTLVRYGDLNLDSRAGIAALHSRLRRAAQDVCSQLESRVLGLRDQYDACVSDAMARGVRDVGNANLSKFHRFGSKWAKAKAVQG